MSLTEQVEVLRYTASLYFMRGEFDLSTDELLRDSLEAWTHDGGPLTIDMSQVTFIDSTAVHALLGALKTAPSGCLILHGPERGVARTLRILGVNAISGVHVNECGDRERDRDRPRVADGGRAQVRGMRSAQRQAVEAHPSVGPKRAA